MTFSQNIKIFKNNTFLVFFLGFVISLQAQEVEQDEGLITDRPDQTESPSLISKGTLQIETGFLYESYSEALYSEMFYAYNTTILRYGLFENLELRLGFDFLGTKKKYFESIEEEAVTGFGPILLGVKVGIRKQEGVYPEMGLLAQIYLPFTANNNFQPETTGGEFRFAFDHVLSERSGLAYNFGAGWGDTSGVKYLYTLVYGYHLTTKLGIYTEIYGELPEKYSSRHNWDSGLTYQFSSDFQIDAYLGSKISSTKDLMVGAGLSYRIQKIKI